MIKRDFEALEAARDVSVNEPEAEQRVYFPRPVRSYVDPARFTRHPISQGEADDACRHYVGIGRFPYHLRDILPVWWGKLRAADTPEEKLTCERMINAINEAKGLHLHGLGSRIVEKNKEQWDTESAASSAAEIAAEEAAAIDRWRGVR